VKYIKELNIEIYQLPLLKNIKETKVNRFYINHDYERKTIENKNKIDNALKNTPNWKDYYDKIYEPLRFIGNFLLKENNNDLDKISTFDLDHYVFSSSLILIDLINNKRDLLKNKKYIDKIEETLSKSPLEAFKYSEFTGKRFLKAEPALIDDATGSFNDLHTDYTFGSNILDEYHNNFIRSRWPEYEKVVIEKKRYNLLLNYLEEFKLDDPYFKKIILESKNQKSIYRYYKKILEKEEDFFLSDPTLLFFYALELTENDIPDSYGDESDEENFIEKHNKIFENMIKYPELMCKFSIQNDYPFKIFEKYISKSSYWSYIYATYFIYIHGLEKEDLYSEMIPSIKKNYELYTQIKKTMFLRSDGGYEPETNLDPSKFGEVEIIKRNNE
jgi:hypothetical protein